MDPVGRKPTWKLDPCDAQVGQPGSELAGRNPVIALGQRPAKGTVGRATNDPVNDHKCRLSRQCRYRLSAQRCGHSIETRGQTRQLPLHLRIDRIGRIAGGIGMVSHREQIRGDLFAVAVQQPKLNLRRARRKPHDLGGCHDRGTVGINPQRLVGRDSQLGILLDTNLIKTDRTADILQSVFTWNQNIRVIDDRQGIIIHLLRLLIGYGFIEFRAIAGHAFDTVV